MKKLLALFLVLICMFSLSACGKATGSGEPVAGGAVSDMPKVGNAPIDETEQTQQANYDEMWDLSDAEPVYVTEWPENEFTSQIITPENGEIDYIYDYSDFGRYAVFMKDMSEEKTAEYIEELKEQGYSEIASEGNDVAVGTMMQKDNVILSISYSGDIFGIMITIENDT